MIVWALVNKKEGGKRKIHLTPLYLVAMELSPWSTFLELCALEMNRIMSCLVLIYSCKCYNLLTPSSLLSLPRGDWTSLLWVLQGPQLRQTSPPRPAPVLLALRECCFHEGKRQTDHQSFPSGGEGRGEEESGASCMTVCAEQRSFQNTTPPC